MQRNLFKVTAFWVNNKKKTDMNHLHIGLFLSSLI